MLGTDNSIEVFGQVVLYKDCYFIFCTRPLYFFLIFFRLSFTYRPRFVLAEH